MTGRSLVTPAAVTRTWNESSLWDTSGALAIPCALICGCGPMDQVEEALMPVDGIDRVELEGARLIPNGLDSEVLLTPVENAFAAPNGEDVMAEEVGAKVDEVKEEAPGIPKGFVLVLEPSANVELGAA